MKYTHKECKEIDSETLAAVFRMTLDSGEVPVLRTQANVVLIFKKGDKTVLSIERPINLTSVIDKLMEAIIAKKVKKHKLITNSHHGFTEGKLCFTKL